jgi:4'-phosphopantetheinyl transferase
MDKNARFMETIEYIRQLPELSENMIHIWGVYVPDMLDRVDALRNVLCERERKKAARFRREADRSSSIAARGALRILLSGYTGIPAAEIGFQYSETGKPFIAMDGSEVDFNVSHSNDWVVLAFGRDCNIGVDVEKIKRDTDVIQIASRFFAPEEVALIKQAEDKHAVFFQLWARKEAYVKARGSGLFRGLSSFSVPINGNKLPECGQKDGWYFHRLEAGSKYAAAVVTDRAVAGVPCYDFGGLKWES